MNNETLNKILLERKKELLKELEAIDIIIDATDSKDVYSEIVKLISVPPTIIPQGSISLGTKILEHNDADFQVSFDHLKHKFYGGGKMIPIVRKVENVTWKSYLIEVIKKLDGSAKTNDIAEVMIYSIKDLSFVRARQIAADLLPELVNDGLLDVEKGNSKKEGHTYMIKGYKLNIVDEYIKKISTQKDA